MKKFFNFLKKLPRRILSGEIFIDEKVRRLYPFLLLFAGIALVWITNTYRARSIQMEIADTQKKLEIEKEALKKAKADYVRKSQPAQLVKKLAADSIKMAHNATQKIVIDKKERGDHE
ncbi:MAG: FtsL-like putative cell division protein [Bacteroidales bacterium]|nr:FtsL-like putative cell division protein [Bacteroidales bacterium]